VLRRHALAPDVHERVARRFVVEGLTPVLDVGCGEGELATHLPGGAWVGVDASAEMPSAVRWCSGAGDWPLKTFRRTPPLPDAGVSAVALR
jgi:SAM-dependent methyltransferase